VASSTGNLIQALIDGGVDASAARVIANALANASSPQFSQSRDSSDQTPTEQLRLITPDTRRYALTNLDYSAEQPYQEALQSYPGRYVPGTADHPYKDSQPILPAPPLSRPRVLGGKYVEVSDDTVDNSQQSTISLRIAKRSGQHVRVNEATNSLDLVPIEITAPQGLVTAAVIEDSSATTIQLQVRNITSTSVALSDGSTASILAWREANASPPAQLITPTGAVMAFAYALAETGWLLCDGRAVGRTAYPSLFAAIGVVYGVGDGSTTFNLPDLRGYFIRGFGTNSDGTASGSIATKQGMATALPTTALTGTTNTTGSHFHYLDIANNLAGSGYSYETGTAISDTDGAFTKFAGDHSHTVSINGGGDTETRPKNLAMYYYIKT
jgi:microcystin-dependent protein